MKRNARLERASVKITHLHQDMNAYFRCWTWRLYLPQRHRPQCEGQCPQTGPSHSCYCWVPANVTGHLMIWRSDSIEWKMCRSAEHGSTCRRKQRAWLGIHTCTVERDAVDSHTSLRGGWKRTKHTRPQSFSPSTIRAFHWIKTFLQS